VIVVDHSMDTEVDGRRKKGGNKEGNRIKGDIERVEKMKKVIIY